MWGKVKPEIRGQKSEVRNEKGRLAKGGLKRFHLSEGTLENFVEAGGQLAGEITVGIEPPNRLAGMALFIDNNY